MKAVIRGLSLVLPLLVASGGALADAGEDVYNRACKKCHRTGIDDAPVAGDKAAWAKLLEKGDAELLKSVIEGKGQMDPRAGKDLSDEECKAGLDYMLKLVR
ncbi:MAG: hypothetical protein Fur0039_18020 [Rhodocyclaceae bacterium]